MAWPRSGYFTDWVKDDELYPWGRRGLYQRGAAERCNYLDLCGAGSERISLPSTLSKVLLLTFKVWGFSGCIFFATCNPQIKT